MKLHSFIYSIVSILISLENLAMAAPNPCSGKAGALGLKQQYCDAATAQKKTSAANQVTAGIYGAAAAVCGVACFADKTPFGVHMQAACSVSSVAAGVGDIIQTQNFMGAMGSLYSAYRAVGDVKASLALLNAPGSAPAAAAGVPGVTGPGTDAVTGVTIEAVPEAGAAPLEGTVTTSAENAGTSTSTSGTQATQAKGIKASCISAAIDVATAGMKLFSAKNASDAAEKNIENAQAVETSLASQPFSFSGPNGMGATAGGTPGNQAGGTGVSNTHLSSSDSSILGGDLCSAAKSTGNLSTALSCAAATGSSLPPITQDPRFGEMIKTATGMDPSEFLKKAMNEGPGKAASDGIVQGTGIEGNAAIQTRAALNALEEAGYNAMNNSHGAYAGGGGRRGGGSNPDPDLGQLMQGLMAQLNPKKPGETENSAHSLLKNWKAGERYPANVAENPRVSLFDRVTSRYRAVLDRVIP